MSITLGVWTYLGMAASVLTIGIVIGCVCARAMEREDRRKRTARRMAALKK